MIAINTVGDLIRALSEFDPEMRLRDGFEGHTGMLYRVRYPAVEPANLAEDNGRLNYDFCRHEDDSSECVVTDVVVI